MRYLLDTNIISDLIRNPQGRAAQRLRQVGEDAVCTSVVVAGELRYGAAKKGSAALLRRVEDFLAGVDVAPLDAPTDAKYGAIRAALEATGEPIGANDLWIAAHACALGAVLATANEREFRRVKDLPVENWLS